MKPKNEQLKILMSAWDFSGEILFVRKVENWIYKIPSEGVFVRFSESSHRSKEQVESELDWLNHLQEQSVLFAHPIKSKSGHFVDRIGDYTVSVFEEVKGKSLSKLSDFTEQIMKNWGKVIGEMHLATQSYERNNSILKRREWFEDQGYIKIPQNLKGDLGLSKEFVKLEKYLNSLSATKENYGLIHADLHHGNFFVNDSNEIVSFDFDDALYHWFAYDLAVPLFTLELSFQMEDVKLDKECLRNHFFEGYKSSGIKTDMTLEMIQKFIDYRTFIIYSWCLENLDNSDLTSGPDKWVQNAIKLCQQNILKLKE